MRAVFAASLLLGLTVSSVAQTVVLRGLVVDAAGKPVEGIAVSPFWEVAGGHTRPVGPSARSGDDGTFQIVVSPSWASEAWTALDTERGRGAVVPFDPEAKGPRVFRLSPLVQVEATITHHEVGDGPMATSLWVYLMPQMQRVLECSPALDGEVRLQLPAGEYQLIAHGDRQVASERRSVTVRGGETLRLGELDLKATVLRRMIGKEPPPLQITDARGVAKSVQPKDYRGKWLILEFWGFW